jgi:hypothetical protein
MHDVVAETGALMFACPRDNGANALERIFREGRRPEADEAPITQSRNAGLYRTGEGESKGCPRIVPPSGYNVAMAPHMSWKPFLAARRSFAG